MNLLYIVIPFFFYSLAVKLISDRTKEKKGLYSKMLFASLLLSSAVSFLFNHNLVLEHALFVSCSTLFFCQNYISNKKINTIIEVLVWAIITGTLYLTGIPFKHIVTIITILIFVYFSLIKTNGDIPFISSQIIPVGIIGIYLSESNYFYTIIFMTLFGTIRFFVEQPKIKESKFLIKIFMLIILILTMSFNQQNFGININIITFGFSFIILDYLNRIILRKDKPLIQRMYLTNLFKSVVLLKAICLNVIAIVLFSLVKFDFVNFYVALSLLTLIILFISLKQWYSENEHIL